MRNSSFIINRNASRLPSSRPSIAKGWLIFSYNGSNLDGNCIWNILCFVAYAREKYGRSIPLYLDLKNIGTVDKLAITVLECICYSLINDFGFVVQVNLQCSSFIFTRGVSLSPLVELNSGRDRSIKFTKKFNLEIYNNHYRRLVSRDGAEEGELGNIYSDIESFLKPFSIQPEYRDAIGEVVVELIGNASEHANADTLVDIDVTDDHINAETRQIGYGINISIASFSDVLFGSALRNKIELLPDKSGRYSVVKRALENHSAFFVGHYTEDDFYNICAFQDKISGRIDASYSGGTGLRTLISTLEKRSDVNNCYMLSGKRVLRFRHELLEYDEDGWIGFNGENSFRDFPPDSSVIDTCSVFFPGTSYNLNFVMLKEE